MEVCTLRLRECASVDVDRLIGLGDSDAVEELTRRIGPELEGLVETMSRIAIAYRDGRLEDLGAGAQDVALSATTLGLSRVARVAHTIYALTQRHDPNALGANVARLMRLGEDTFEAIWQIQDAQH